MLGTTSGSTIPVRLRNRKFEVVQMCKGSRADGRYLDVNIQTVHETKFLPRLRPALFSIFTCNSPFASKVRLFHAHDSGVGALRPRLMQCNATGTSDGSHEKGKYLQDRCRDSHLMICILVPWGSIVQETKPADLVSANGPYREQAEVWLPRSAGASPLVL